MKRLALLLALVAVPAAAQHQHEPTGAPVAGPSHPSAYAEGLYLLHNFEYDRSAEAFRRVQAAEPGNVMAYWGEAMTYNHPLWAFQDREKGRAVLTRLGPTPEARRARARNSREAGWLAAVEALYGEGDKLARDRAYHAKMMALFEADPSDIDARTFAALATLGLANEGRDTAIYMRAAALLEEAFPAHADHPGLLHYMIHSYDDPAHAPLGQRAAKRYALVAPDAGHAQHMVSHIHLALGDWQAVEATNVQAMKVVNAQRAASGRAPAWCGHYNEWLVYALDQQGKASDELVENCRRQAMDELARGTDKKVLGAERSPFNSWATIAVRHGVDTGRWPAFDAVPSGDGNLLGRFDLAYGRILAHRGDPVATAAAVADLRRYRDGILAAMPTERPDDHESAPWLDLAVSQAEAIAALARGDKETGLNLLAAAAKAEAALPQPFGPPILAKPSAELLGDHYRALGRKPEAAEAYRQSLAMMPGRRLSQSGLENMR
ncbi:MAG TPA: hypothetical protein VFR36_03615 [Sphingomicrobium sp.]|nr:hypothetical protein [Sphingomicrobium sp.]